MCTSRTSRTECKCCSPCLDCDFRRATSLYRREGFADIWAKGQRRREYDCTLITEKDNSGCLRDCAAKVITEGRKDWWVRVKTKEGLIGWAKAEDQFDCMDSLGGDSKCDSLDSPLSPADETPTNIDDARTQVEANLRAPEGKAYDARLGAEFTQKHSDTARLCKKSADDDTENSWMLLKLGANGKVTEFSCIQRQSSARVPAKPCFETVSHRRPGPRIGWAFT